MNKLIKNLLKYILLSTIINITMMVLLMASEINVNDVREELDEMMSETMRKRSYEEEMRESSLQRLGATLRPSSESPSSPPFSVNCSKLLAGQFRCDPALIDPETQEAFGCTKENVAWINCSLRQGLVCRDTGSRNFSMAVECRHTNGYSFEKALLLSIFLGMFGADRFYLGFPALGLLKFCTLGFLFLGQLVDIILIAMQIVGPADGSHYVIKYFGPRITLLSFDNINKSIDFGLQNVEYWGRP